MTEKLKVHEVIIVEGKYDKIALEPVVDGIIIPTDGFRIFKDKEKQRLIRRLAAERGLLVLTDSDGAGLVIRNFIAGCVDPAYIKNAYIPKIEGKERRKSEPSKEGTLGVEGMTVQVLAQALERAGIVFCDSTEQTEQITRERLYEDGYIGRENSAVRKKKLLAALSLPDYLSTNALLRVINLVCDLQNYSAITEKIHEEEKAQQ